MSDITVKMKLSQADTGKLYMKSIRHENEAIKFRTALERIISIEFISSQGNPYDIARAAISKAGEDK